MADCKFCGKAITWIKEEGRNVPLESDGGIHECEEFKRSRASFKKINRTTLSPEEVARYEQGINRPKK